MLPEKTLFTPIQGRRTFEAVSDQIKRLIFKGLLKPGDRLPSEAALARQFGVGRQTIRESLRLLELSGFIRISRGGRGGPIVRDTILNTISRLFGDAFQLHKVTLQELTLARLDIERIIVERVIEHADESDFKDLERNVKEALEKVARGHMATEENIEFHRLLARASKNHVFYVVIGSIMAVLGDLLSRIGPDLDTSRRVATCHGRLVIALQARRRRTALKLLDEHLLEIQERLRAFESNPIP